MPHSFFSRGAQNFLFAYGLLAELYRAGCSHTVISPGSRSTPLTLAAAHLSGTVSIMLDERSAGFYALGCGKATGRPAVLICTSGTAAANYYPAVIEARMTQTPLIVISADRPAGLQRRMSPQTIHQQQLFGEYSRLYAESEPLLETMINTAQQGDEAAPGPEWHQAFGRVSVLAQRMMQSCLKGGPVHLNAAFSKPLEPAQEQVPALIDIAGKALKRHKTPDSGQMPSPETSEDTLLPLWENDGPQVSGEEENTAAFSGMMQLLGGASRPLVIAGPLNAGSRAERDLLRLSSQIFALPHLFEATATPFSTRREGLQAPVITGYEGFLRQSGIRRELMPDLILRIGAPPVSRALNEFLQELSGIPQLCFSSTEEPPDPLGTAETLIQLPAFQALPDAMAKIFASTGFPVKADWSDRWKKHSAEAANLLEVCIPEHRDQKQEEAAGSPRLTDGSSIRLMLHHCETTRKTAAPALFVSNSFAVRDLDVFRSAALPFQQIGHNRGASGIDGIISTALGYCTASGQETWLLIGDLAFLHDSNALLQLSRHQGPDFRVLVTNNAGGNIFRMLPVHAHQPVYTSYFETPQKADIADLCRAHGISCRIAESEAALAHQLETYGRSGESRVMVFEARTDPEASMNQRYQLWSCGS
jgi:2-succinyl-5-enolpyruvyl-6-hydroxy-3-cyclohexene-1-carboxylate synthase